MIIKSKIGFDITLDNFLKRICCDQIAIDNRIPQNLVIKGFKIRKWPMFVESGHRFGFLSPRSATFDSDRNQVLTNLRSSGSISVESDVKVNLPSGFGLRYFIVFNSISREDRSNHCSKSREISCLKHG